MTTTVTVDGGNATLTIEITANALKMQDTINDAVRKVLGRHPKIDFDSMTDQEKLDKLEEFIVLTVRNWAKATHAVSASQQIDSEAEDKYL